jgi:putative methionine-R-sulfoxide reductase with GAF domain
MCAASRSPHPLDWGDLGALGEQIVSATSLAAQRDQIHAMVSSLVRGEAAVWLQEDLFRLPDSKDELNFTQRPPSTGMQRAMQTGQLRLKKNRGTKTNGSRAASVAVPLEEQGITLGAIQVDRPKGPAFKKDELSLLEGIASVISVGLVASHRVAVERFRLNQLNLVRQVSAQIANTLSVTELAERVTGLIQKTFHYYYVAIFTVQDNSTSLRFRASAMPKAPRPPGTPRRRGRRRKVALEVEVGQGLIGQVAAEGERVIVPDVQQDARYRFIDALPETRSEAVIPLKIEGRVLGVLDVQSDQVNGFHPNDLLVLEALGRYDRTRGGWCAPVQRPAPPRQPVDPDRGREQERQFLARPEHIDGERCLAHPRAVRVSARQSVHRASEPPCDRICGGKWGEQIGRIIEVSTFARRRAGHHPLGGA